MEKKSGIIVTREGLFIPARYFEQMAQQLEIVLAAEEIKIRSSAKKESATRRREVKRKPAKAN
jgi:hypothetical protein